METKELRWLERYEKEKQALLLASTLEPATNAPETQADARATQAEVPLTDENSHL